MYNNIIFKVCIFICLTCCLYPVSVFAGKKVPEPVDWESPLPKVIGSDIDLKEVEKLIGERGQFIFRRKARPLTCLVEGKMKTYEGGVIVSSMKIINSPVDKVKEIIKDYSIINDIQSQHTNLKFVSKKGNHTVYSYNQQYKYGIITLNTDFLVQQTLENDGSISTMLHEGDVESQIQRWEFLALDEERTMLILTFWSAYSTAKFSFKILLAVMAESHLIAPVMYCSMYLEQYSDYIQKGLPQQEVAAENIKEKPELTFYTEQLSDKGRVLMESLVAKGAVYLRTYQFVKDRSKLERISTVTKFVMLNVPFDQAAPVISDMCNLTESIQLVKSVKHKETPERVISRTKYRIGKFPISISFFTQQTFNETENNHLTFRNPGVEGAFSPYAGAYEWSRMDEKNTGEKDSTLYIFSHILKVGPDANFPVRTLGKLMPDSDNVMLVFSTIVIVEPRIRWIEAKYKEMMNDKT